MKSAVRAAFVLSALGLAATGFADQMGWPQRGGGPKEDAAQAVATDDAGNIYVAGRFEGTATFGSFTLISSGSSDIYVGKLDNVGNWLWATRAGGSQADIANGIAVDNSGNVYVTGSFQSAATFGSTQITGQGAGDNDVFVAKLDPFGSWRWARAANGGGGAAGLGIAVNGASEVYVTGYYNGTLVFAGSSLGNLTTNWPTATDNDIFVAKLTEGGDWKWAMRGGGLNAEGQGTQPDMSPANCLFDADPSDPRRGSCTTAPGTGCPLNTQTYPNVDVNSQSWCCAAWGQCGSFWFNIDEYWCQYIAFGTPDNAGYSLYGRQVCTPKTAVNAYSDDRGTAIQAVDTTVNLTTTTSIYVTGSFQGNLQIAQGLQAAAPHKRDVFVAKVLDLGTSGSWRWAIDSATNTAGGRDASNDAMVANALQADADGNLWIAGSYNGSPQLGSLPPLEPTASLGASLSSSSSDVPKGIFDYQTVQSKIIVTDTKKVTDVNVTVDISHTFDADLILTLIGPNGTRIALSNRRGGGGDNFSGTTFDDEATTAISAGSAPFTGSFIPDQALSGLDGIAANGTWTLEVSDNAGADQGTINSWSLDLTLQDSVTSLYVAKLNDNLSSASWAWGTTAGARNQAGSFAEGVALAVDQRQGPDQGIYVTGNFRGDLSFDSLKTDLVTGAGSAIVSSASSDFVTAGLQAGDAILITTGSDAGSHTIASVDSATQLTFTAALTADATGISFGSPSFYLQNYSPASPNRDVAVAKLTAGTGDWLWAKKGGSFFDDEVRGIVSDPSGTTFVVGRFQALGRFAEGNAPFTYNEAVQGTYDVSETAYGVSLWFKTTCANCGIYSVLAGIQGANGHDRHLYLSNGNLRARVWSNETISTVGLNLADGQWHHVVHTFGPGVGQRLYVDGNTTPAAVGSKTFSNFTGQTDVAIGFSNDAANQFMDGTIQNVQIFNRVLTTTDVTTLHAYTPFASTEVLLKAAGQSDAFLGSLNPEAPGQWRSFEQWVSGEEVPRPAGVPALQPDIQIGELDGQSYFFWSVFEKKLYAVRPTAALIKWKVSSSPSDLRRVLSFGASDWPTNPQIHIAGAPADLELPGAIQTASSCSANPPASPVVLSYGGIRYTTNAAGDGNKVFSALAPGYTVLLYAKGPSADTTQFPAVLQVVRTYNWDDPAVLTDNVPATIGTKVDPTAVSCVHDDPTGKNGWVVFPNSRYDGSGNDRAHDRATRSGPIIPVNEAPQNDMVVVWYKRSLTKTGMTWPSVPTRYNVQWPASPDKIVIASELGSEVYGQPVIDDAVFTNKRVYAQADPNQPGFNPNEEHAAFFLSNNGSGKQALFALRSDLTSAPDGLLTPSQAKSRPYALLKYQDAASGEWLFHVYKVVPTDANYPGFTYAGRAGNPVFAPYPVRLMGDCAGTAGTGTPFWKDYKNQTWARSAGVITGRYYYPLLPTFYYDIDGNGTQDVAVGQCVPWLDRMPARTDCPGGPGACIGTPIAVTYDICWPDETQRDFGAGPQACSGTAKQLGIDFGFLQVGETLTTPKNGAPDIKHQAAAEVVYDDENPNLAVPGAQPPPGLPDPTKSLVQLIDPFSEVTVDLAAMPGDIQTQDASGRKLLVAGTGGSPVAPHKLAFALRSRIFYDPLNHKLGFKGYFDDSGAGDPLLLLNVLTQRDVTQLKQLSQDTNWPTVVDALYDKTRNPRGLRLRPNYDPNQARPAQPNKALLIGLQDANDDGIPEPVKLLGIPGALTAGATTGANEYVTVAFGNNPILAPGPVSLQVIKVVCPPGPYQGQVEVIQSDNVFDEQLTLRHSGDFGGNPDALNFEWFTTPDLTGTPPPLPANQLDYGNPGFDPSNVWQLISPTTPVPNGAIDVTIEGADIKTLSDNWFAVRYKGYPVCNNAIGAGTNYSTWSGQPGSVGQPPLAQFGPGWIKRVTEGLNPFEARVLDFHKAATQTYASMIQQLGPRYEGDVALSADPSAINSVGLIEAYETVLRRGIRLSIDGTPPVNYGPINNALLNVTTRIADFYMLLGNEAYADAQDPTIGFGTKSGQYGTLAPTIFAFQNQVDSLLDEELVLLRGRDNSNATTGARPVYNRFFWNFTNGEGEIAYSQVYNIQDVGGCNDVSRCGTLGGPDGVIDEKDAKIMFPQGHGDAWGHYLTAMTTYYRLLRHPFFTWENRPEAVLVAGVPVQVDYLDERKFAKDAALKAKAGAEIVNLTYRSAYVEDPAGQWQGYKDTNTDRAWGLSEWGKRAGQAAYFDWVVANSLLPDVDPNPAHTGIQKIDRTTVTEIGEIASHYTEIQTKVDEADFGLNPLGLAKGVVPFDIDPSLIDSGETHFEQIHDRATKALNNALTTFDNANQISQMLRQNQDTLEDFARNVGDQERDYKNRLIEIFGYPYADDIGPTGIYPTGYDGPDFYHYMYVDSSELTGDKAPPTSGITGRFSAVPGIGFWLGDDANAHSGSNITKDIPYTMSLNGFGLVKPQSFTGKRRAPGDIQRALADLYTERARYQQSLANYDNLVRQIQDSADLLQAQYNLNATQISIMNTKKNTIIGLNVGIGIAKAAQLALQKAAEEVKDAADAIAAGVPTVTIAGLAVGGDFFSAIRGAVKGAGSGLSTALEIAADVADVAQTAMELGKEQVDLETEISLTTNSQNFEVLQKVKELEQLIRQEPGQRLDCYIQKGVVQQQEGTFLSALAGGQRLIDELVSFRAQTASDVQEYRYQDMAFRVFRNDALQKYRAQFDLAARYAFLDATAYDYETNLLGTASGAGRKFLTDIVRQRNLGQVIDGTPIPGSNGLADPIARMGQNFDVLKGQLGFNNPQTETNRFSLRKEMFRQDDADPNSITDSTDDAWRANLAQYRVANLWDVPEFKRYCRAFAPEDAGPQPGLVIPFNTTVTFGLNFFGWPLGGGDSTYDPTNFATKVRSVGVWFGNYDNTGLSNTPRVYLVPAGADVLRSPTGNTFATRQWRVADQVLPVPFPIGASDLNNAGYIPLNDNLSDSLGGIRKLSSFRAYHLGQGFDDSEMTADSRLVGRSVWNTRWLLIIPGGTLLFDSNEGLNTLINGRPIPGSTARDGNGISDIQIFFKTYAYSGN